jgi:nucleotide-binding universal stress UspA family protein
VRVAVIPVFPRVLAGIDFGPASLAAARWAFAHVACDAHAILAHVATSCEESRSGDAAMSPVRAVNQLIPALTGGLGGFAATFRVASTRSVVRLGRPSYWLVSLSARTEAALVVLGRRSNAHRRRIGEPNVMERVAGRTTASVLVVPEGVHAQPRYILAAIDRSAIGVQVVATATALAELHGYTVVVLHVLTPLTGEYARATGSARHGRVPFERVATGIEVSDVPGEPAPSWLEELTPHVPAFTEYSKTVAHGDPARAIMAEAHRLGAAVVIVGKRGEDQSPIGSLGSVARELLASSSVPVLAVDARSEPADESRERRSYAINLKPAG